MNIWQILEIEKTDDLIVIKKAYAKKLKSCNPEVNPEGFKLLREAYEEASKSAQNKSYNDDIQNQTYTEKVENQVKLRSEIIESVNQLIDVLYADESKAIDILDGKIKNGELDNLEYSDQYQTILAVNLLPICKRYHLFISFCIDSFDWLLEVEKKHQDQLFNVAVANLINETKSIRFYYYLNDIRKIRNEKEAKKLDIDWQFCKAAKILLGEYDPIKFNLSAVFCDVNLVYELCEIIMLDHQELIGRQINADNIFWWERTRKASFTDLSKSVIIIVILFICMAIQYAQYLQQLTKLEIINGNQAKITIDSDSKKISYRNELQNKDQSSISILKPNYVPNYVNDNNFKLIWNIKPSILRFYGKARDKAIESIIIKNEIDVSNILLDKFKIIFSELKVNSYLEGVAIEPKISTAKLTCDDAGICGIDLSLWISLYRNGNYVRDFNVSSAYKIKNRAGYLNKDLINSKENVVSMVEYEAQSLTQKIMDNLQQPIPSF